MRIAKITLRNFKSFGEQEQVAPLGKRLTLIFGRNSAGKSSIVQALLALRQSWRSEPDITQLRTQGDLVALGRFGNVVHEQRGPDLMIGLQGERLPLRGSEATSPVDRPSAMEFFGPTRFRFGADFLPPSVSQETPELPWTGALDEVVVGEGASVWSLHPLDDGDSSTSVLRLGVSPEFWRRGGAADLTGRDVRNLTALLGDERPPVQAVIRVRPQQVDASLDSLRRPPDVEEDRWLVSTNRLDSFRATAEKALGARIVHVFNRDVIGARDALFALRHIAQTRAAGRRIYEVEPDRGRLHVGRHGGHVAQMLFESPPLLERTNQLLDVLDAGIRLDFNHELRSPGTGLEMRVIAKGSKARLTLLDVGSGISQVLPVVVQYAHELIQSERGQEGILWVEQPELHLHPHMQMLLLGLLLVDHVGGTAPQVVFETHSEVLVAAARQLVAEGRLSADDVKVLWVGRRQDGTAEIVDLLMNEAGGFGHPWPQGFFTERMDIARGRVEWPSGT